MSFKSLTLALAFLLTALPPHTRAQSPEDKLAMKAHAAQDAQNFDLAIQYWSAALKLDPKDSSAWFNRAVAYESKKQFDKALADANAALQLTPNDPATYELRGQIYLDQSQDGVFKSDIFKKAVADYSKAIRLGRQDAAGTRSWLADKMSPGSADNANVAMKIAWWSAIISLDPKKSDSWYDRAQVEKDDDSDQALADYAEAIRLDPKNANAYLARADFYEDLGDPGKNAQQIADYTGVIRLDPESRERYMLRAAVYDRIGENEKAAADYSEAIRLAPGNPDAYQGRGWTYNREGKWDKAIADFDEMVRLAPKNSGYYKTRGRAWYDKGDYDKAIADFDQTIILDAGERVEDYNIHAEACSCKKDWDQVIADMTKAIELQEKEPGTRVSDSLIMRGEAWWRKEMYEKAIADFNRGIETEVSDWTADNAAAWFYATCPDSKFRNGPKAVKIAMQACMDSRWSETGLIDTLAAAEAEAGQWQEAINYEKLAIKLSGSKEAEALREDDDFASIPGQNGAKSMRTEYDQKIKVYTARVALYKNKQPSREEKKLDWLDW